MILIVRTYHVWPSQMHDNLLINRVKKQAIWTRVFIAQIAVKIDHSKTDWSARLSKSWWKINHRYVIPVNKQCFEIYE